MMKRLALLLCAMLAAPAAQAAGTLPLALVQQFDMGGNGQPLGGALLYLYVAGTVATPQQVYQDFALTIPAPNPLEADASGRIPMFWCADGLIHARLTDASGVVQLDTTMQVLGPSSGGGSGPGPGGVDPTTVAATGDIKARLTAELLTGWVFLNGTTIGGAASGATQRANADTQNLFVYLWQNCVNPHCPVPGGRGSSALSDFNASKQITVPDLRGRAIAGRDCMAGGCAGRLLTSNISSGSGDGVDTAGAWGGVANQPIAYANLPAETLAVTTRTVAGEALAINIPVSVSSLTNINISGFGVTVVGGNHQHGPAVGTGFVNTVVGGGLVLAGGGGSNAGAAAVTNFSGNLVIGGNINNGSVAGCSGACGSGQAVGSATGQLDATGSAALTGGGQPLPVKDPFVLGTWYMKL